MTGGPDGGAGFTIERSDVVHEGPVVRTEMASLRTPEGDLVQRQVVRHQGAVAVVAVHEGQVVLVEQYRVSLDRLLVEIPAGKLDVVGESRTAAAERELIEEVGLAPNHLIELGTFHTAAGFSDEAITIFATDDCVEVDRAVDGVEELHSRVLRFTPGQALALAAGGELTDSKTIVGLFWAQQRGLFEGLE